MKEQIALYLISLVDDIASLPSTLIFLAVLITMCVMVLDSLSNHVRKKQKAAGISSKSTLLSVDGATSLPIKNYVSNIQGLAGRPDAIIREGGFIIPVERKPLARKVRDR